MLPVCICIDEAVCEVVVVSRVPVFTRRLCDYVFVVFCSAHCGDVRVAGDNVSRCDVYT